MPTGFDNFSDEVSRNYPEMPQEARKNMEYLTDEGGLFAVTRGLSEMQELAINEVNPGELPDGVYTGEFDRYRWSNKVEVTVVDGKIVDIQPDSDQALALELSERIIARQSLQVDIDTGATVSSKAFLKAVEKALSHQCLSGLAIADIIRTLEKFYRIE